MWINFFYLLCSVIALMQAIVEDDEKLISKSFERGLTDYLETGEMSKTLNETLMLLQLPQYFRQIDEKGILSSTACVACKSSISVLLFARRNGASRNTLKGLIEKLCSWLNIETEIVCSGAVGLNIDTLIYIADNSPTLTSEKMCSIFLQEMDCGSSNYGWQINIASWGNYIHTRGLSNLRSKPLKILQLTDFHYDPGYQAFSNAACKDPLCCRIKSKPFALSDTAGYWGDYRNCDTPWHAFEDAIDHIVDQHKDLDYVYFTGDVVNHLVWGTSVSSNIGAITKVYGHLRQKFNTTPIYYVLGNHDSHPANQFAPIEITRSDLSTNWMYELAAEQWKGLPKEAHETILKGGYYTTLVKPGFRIVALNSNVGYIFNWWLLYNDVDPYGQLQWLADVLSQAESNRELVHILSHVPTNDEHCIKNWAKQYARIIDRFSHIITAQFNGHTHFDDVIVYFNTSNPAQPINAAFNGGSLTTYNNLNPNYKVYQVDPESLEVIDVESWTYNITEANLQPKARPRWYKLYSFNEAFYTENLMPYSLESAVVLMAQNASLLNNYFRYKHRDAGPAVLFGCDEECELKILCYMVTPHIDSLEKCEVVKAEYYRARGRKKT